MRFIEYCLFHLYSAVAPVSHNDVSIHVCGHSSGSIELTVAFTMRAKFKQELSICIVHLGQEVSEIKHLSTSLHAL